MLNFQKRIQKDEKVKSKIYPICWIYGLEGNMVFKINFSWKCQEHLCKRMSAQNFLESAQNLYFFFTQKGTFFKRFAQIYKGFLILIVFLKPFQHIHMRKIVWRLILSVQKKIPFRRSEHATIWAKVWNIPGLPLP